MYSSSSDTVNCGRAEIRSPEVHLPSITIHERGATLFPCTGAVKLGVSRGSDGDVRHFDASLMEEMDVLEDAFCALSGGSDRVGYVSLIDSACSLRILDTLTLLFIREP